MRQPTGARQLLPVGHELRVSAQCNTLVRHIPATAFVPPPAREESARLGTTTRGERSAPRSEPSGLYAWHSCIRTVSACPDSPPHLAPWAWAARGAATTVALYRTAAALPHRRGRNAASFGRSAGGTGSPQLSEMFPETVPMHGVQGQRERGMSSAHFRHPTACLLSAISHRHAKASHARSSHARASHVARRWRQTG